MRKPTPLFVHDCDCCTFLGTVVSSHRPEGFSDLYRCDAHGPTVVARFGDAGPAYSAVSLRMAEFRGGELAIAGKLAEELC